VPPTQYVFTVLIGVLGRVGYTEKAFNIFNKVCSIIMLSSKTLHQKYHPKASTVMVGYLEKSAL